MAITPQPRDLSPLAFAIDRIAQRFTNSTIIYGPNAPLQPIAQEQAPRRMQYPVGVNMVWQPRRDWPNLTPFDTLRYLTKRHPLAALCIRARSQHVMGLSGRAVAKDKKAQAAEQGAADAVMQLLDRPDGTTPRAVWLQMLVRDLLEVDAPTIYKRPSRDGGLSQLEVVDGATIKPILNDRGRVVAYQQVIYGVALSQYLGRRVGLDEEIAVGEYAPGELWYQPFNAAVTDPYGRAPMEDLIEMAKTYLRKIDSDLTRFTDGNIPAALGIVEGGGLSPDQVLTFEEDFNAHLQGLDSRGSRIKFVPFPVKVERLQELSTGGQYETAWEEHNVKMVCAAYGVTPAELGFLADVNRATADAAENTTFRIGIKPLALWLKTVLFDPIIQRDLGQTQLEWQWEGLEASDDTEKTARIDNIYGGLGVVSPDELRTMRYPDLEGKAPGQPQANPAAGVPMPQPAAPTEKSAEGVRLDDPFGIDKHLGGRHNQKAHGRGTAVRVAYRESYATARAQGASVGDARATAKAAGAQARGSAGGAPSAEAQATRAEAGGKAERAADIAARQDTPPAVSEPPARTFRTAAAADKHYTETAPVQAASLSKSEAQALRTYQGAAYQDVNSALRSGNARDLRENASVIKGVDSAMARSQLTEAATLHRGMVVTPGTPGADFLAKLQPGSSFKEPGYLSTTADKSVASNFARSGARGARQVNVTIRAPKGTRAMYLNAALPKQGMLDFTREREMLLDRGLNYRVVSRRDGKNGQTDIELEVIP